MDDACWYVEDLINRSIVCLLSLSIADWGSDARVARILFLSSRFKTRMASCDAIMQMEFPRDSQTDFGGFRIQPRLAVHRTLSETRYVSFAHNKINVQGTAYMRRRPSKRFTQ